MTNSKEVFNDLVSRIALKEDKSEIQSIVYLLLEKKFGLTKTQILAGKEMESVDPADFELLIHQMNHHVPIQYLLGEADFCGRAFMVNPSVLIPRPETELLIEEVKNHLLKTNSGSSNILDIGTGSGCIAITLALEIKDADVQATDISKQALITAQQNAENLTATVKFHEHDILHDEISFGVFDVIVSNPPYISEQEKKEMKQNVLAHEPHLALFAPQHDALAFYKVIASKSKNVLSPGGSVWVEINEHFGDEVVALFQEQGYYTVRIIKDFDQKNRIVTALR
jgi:release factor glutamine methyltransferase